MIAVLSGGVGAARFLEGLVEVVDPAEITAIVNTGDDLEWNTLRVCPDLDTVTYTLAGANAATGWGLAGESWNAIGALGRFGAPTWFGIGDQDLATHLFRSEALGAGSPLSEVTARICSAFGVFVRVLPMTDDIVRTRLTVEGGDEIDFQEYFVHRRHEVAVTSVRFVGADEASAAPGVLAALESASTIIIAPSNPIVSIGPILAISEIGALLERRREDVIAISPIVAGRALKGPADRLLIELGHRSSATGVAEVLCRYCLTLVVDVQDRAEAGPIEALGMRCLVTDTVMRDAKVQRELARVVVAGAHPRSDDDAHTR